MILSLASIPPSNNNAIHINIEKVVLAVNQDLAYSSTAFKIIIVFVEGCLVSSAASSRRLEVLRNCLMFIFESRTLEIKKIFQAGALRRPFLSIS